MNSSNAFSQRSDTCDFLVGTYTKGKSEGIYLYTFNTVTGKISYKNQIGGIKNPSYLAVSKDHTKLFAVEEQGKGNICAYSFDPVTGQARLLNRVSSGGTDPCYISLDPDEKFLAVANYSSGSVSLLPINKDGSLQDAVQLVKHEGAGADPVRQKSAHAHSADFSADGKSLLVCDLGIDKLMIYPLQKNGDKLVPGESARTEIPMKAGSGPRHIAFHPKAPFLYIVQELSGNIEVFDYKEGMPVSIGSVAAFPASFKGNLTAAELACSPDGKFIYVSLRGDLNEIVSFAINPVTGMPELKAHTATGGKTPRHFTLDPTGKWLLAANQDSDDIVVFKRNTRTGKLMQVPGKTVIGAPTHLLFIK